MPYFVIKEKFIRGLVFFAGLFSGLVACAICNFPEVRHLTESYIGNSHRVDLVSANTRYWLQNICDSKLDNVRSFERTKVDSGKKTKFVRVEGFLKNHNDFDDVSNSIESVMKEYSALMTSNFDVKLECSIAHTETEFVAEIKIANH